MNDLSPDLHAALRSAPPVSGQPDPRYIAGAESRGIRARILCGSCSKVIAELRDYYFAEQDELRVVQHSRIDGRTSFDLSSPRCRNHTPRKPLDAEQLLELVLTARSEDRVTTRRV